MAGDTVSNRFGIEEKMKLVSILEQGLFARGKICDDCLNAVAGDISGNSDSWNEHAFASTCDSFEILTGEIHDGEWPHDCFHKGKPCEDDCECQITQMSTELCRACYQKDDGKRHDVLFIRRSLYGRSS